MGNMKEQRIHVGGRFRHKAATAVKFFIVFVLSFLSVFLIVIILRSSQSIARKTLIYHPLYAYFQEQFQLNRIDQKNLEQNLFTKKSQREKFTSQNQQKKIQIQNNQRIVNIVYQNATQSHHFDNWLFLGQYISFLVNRKSKIIKSKIATENFMESYQHFKSKLQTDQQNKQYEFQNQSLINRKNQAILSKFSQSFQRILDTQFIPADQFEQKNIAYKIKIASTQIIERIFPVPKIEKSTIIKHRKKGNKVWIFWVLSLEGQKQDEIQQLLRKLKKNNPKDKIILLSLFPLMQNHEKIIYYQPANKKYFQKFLKNQMNLTNSHIKLISRHYEYSLFSLGQNVQNNQNFNIQGLMGGKFSYSDLKKFPPWIIEKIINECKGQKTKVSRIFQQEQKILFYRLGLYKIESQIYWKNKHSKRNFQFQTGNQCKQIPLFQMNYFSLLGSFDENVIFDFFQSSFKMFGSNPKNKKYKQKKK